MEFFKIYTNAKFKMASRSGGGYGGKSSNSDRKWIYSDVTEDKKEWKRCHKRIYQKVIFSKCKGPHAQLMTLSLEHVGGSHVNVM